MNRLYIAFLSMVVATAAFTVQPHAHYRLDGNVKLNDSTLTPGKVLTTDTAKICKRGYSKTVRNVPQAIKNAVYKEYGIAKSKKLPREVDHLISLELGGANDISNLWPQPFYEHPGAYEKDKVENWLHAEVCAGRIAIVDAQNGIARNWMDYYRAMNGGS